MTWVTRNTLNVQRLLAITAVAISSFAPFSSVAAEPALTLASPAEDALLSGSQVSIQATIALGANEQITGKPALEFLEDGETSAAVIPLVYNPSTGSAVATWDSTTVVDSSYVVWFSVGWQNTVTSETGTARCDANMVTVRNQSPPAAVVVGVSVDAAETGVGTSEGVVLTATVADAQTGLPVGGQAVQWSTSLGDLTSTTTVTNAMGVAIANLASEASGTATVTAASCGAQGQTTVLFQQAPPIVVRTWFVQPKEMEVVPAPRPARTIGATGKTRISPAPAQQGQCRVQIRVPGGTQSVGDLCRLVSAQTQVPIEIEPGLDRIPISLPTGTHSAQDLLNAIRAITGGQLQSTPGKLQLFRDREIMRLASLPRSEIAQQAFQHLKQLWKSLDGWQRQRVYRGSDLIERLPEGVLRVTERAYQGLTYAELKPGQQRALTSLGREVYVFQRGEIPRSLLVAERSLFLALSFHALSFQGGEEWLDVRYETLDHGWAALWSIRVSRP